MEYLELKSRAKINMILDVINKREDGYHNLEMIMQTLELCDTLKIEKIKADEIKIETNMLGLPVDDRNLVHKAIKAIKNRFKIADGFFVQLEKVIPIEAGLAGGSANAATALIGMNTMLQLNMTQEDLINIGKGIGADVPYCIMGGTALAQGIGEILTPIRKIQKLYIVLVKPPVNVNTKEAFQNINLKDIREKPDTRGMIKAIEERDVKAIGNKLSNVFESYALEKYRIIKEIKTFLLNEGALGSLMTGSGSAVYGIFESKEYAESVFEKVKMRFQNSKCFLTETY